MEQHEAPGCGRSLERGPYVEQKLQGTAREPVSTAFFLSCWTIPVLWPITVSQWGSLVPISGLKNQRGEVGIHRKPSASKNKAKERRKRKRRRREREGHKLSPPLTGMAKGAGSVQT